MSNKTFVANEDTYSPAHERYRLARAMLGLEHYEFYRLLAAADQRAPESHHVSSAEAKADCKAMLTALKTRTFVEKPYIARYVRDIGSGRLTLSMLASMAKGQRLPGFTDDSWTPVHGLHEQPHQMASVAA